MTKIVALNPAIALSRNGSNVLEIVKFKHLGKFVKKAPRHTHAQSSNFLDSFVAALMDT